MNKTLTKAAVAAVAALTILPAAAPAATLIKSSNGMTYTAAAGESNSVSAYIAADGKPRVFSNVGFSALGFGCVRVSSTEASCVSAEWIDVKLGDGNDSLNQGPHDKPLPVTAFGGPGNDSLVGGDGVVDKLNGDIGDDYIDGGRETNNTGDVLHGGTDNDTVSYTARSSSVNIAPGASNASGEAAEQDTVTAFDVYYGGGGNDTLGGTSASEVFWGMGGNDTIHGGGASDVLQGGFGDDYLDGQAGIDTLQGYAGKDTLSAQDGQADIIWCAVHTSVTAGADTVYWDVGVDYRVNC